MKRFLSKSNKGKYKVAQRFLSFKKKTRLTIMNMHAKLLNSHIVHPPLSDGGRVEPPTKFSKTGVGLDRTSPSQKNKLRFNRGKPSKLMSN